MNPSRRARRLCGARLAAGLAFCLLPLVLPAALPAVAAPGTPPPAGTERQVGYEAALGRLAPGLRAMAQGDVLPPSPELNLLVLSDRPLPQLPGATRAVTVPWFLGRTLTLARVRAASLAKLAAQPGVLRVENAAAAPLSADEAPVPGHSTAEEDLRRLQRSAVLRAAAPLAEAPAQAGEPAVEWPDSHPWFAAATAHRTSAAWAGGWRGQGVQVAVVDQGVDFGTPELYGAWATDVDPTSPYAGWPLALDASGLVQLMEDRHLGTRHAALGHSGFISATQQSTATQVAGFTFGEACFRPVKIAGQEVATPVCDFEVPLVSRSGIYRYGAHPDVRLTLLGHRSERVGVLVVDTREPGVYDTVYVDLDADHSFADESSVGQRYPLATRDLSFDGLADVSGGLLYWISDGVHPPPGGWLWGARMPVPRQGELIALMGEWDGTHGTMCASNIAARGRVPPPRSVELSFADLPAPGRPPVLLRGVAPDAHIVAVRTGDSLVTESAYWWAARGPNQGRPESAPQVVSNSFGFSEVENEGWDDLSRLVDHLAKVAPATTFVFSSGNGGPGYGTTRGPEPRAAVKVAAATHIGTTGYDSIATTSQFTGGDIISFSSNGPAPDATLGPHVAAEGAFGFGAQAVNTALDGALTLRTWAGTSRAAPVAAGHLALIYQAFRDRTSRWPTTVEARALLMSGARFAGYDAFLSGAGLVDGERSTAIAHGDGGVFALPDVLYPGDYRGRSYPDFPSLVPVGSSRPVTLTLVNPATRPMSLSLSAAWPRRIGHHTFDWTSQPVALESAPFTEVPDYVLPLPREVIPPETELMAVRMVMPLAESDIGVNYTTDNAWYLRVYQHNDRNGDGAWWHDADGDGTVDKQFGGPSTQIDRLLNTDWAHTEVDRYEYLRLGQDTRPSNNGVVWVRQPLDRWRDGLYIGLQHADATSARPALLPRTQLRFQLDFYRHVDWPWLRFEPEPVLAPAGAQVVVTGTLTVPDSAPLGFHEGRVFLSTLDASGSSDLGERQSVPVVVNVGAVLGDITKYQPPKPRSLFLPALSRTGGVVAAQLSPPRPTGAAPQLGEVGEAAADAPYASGHVRGYNHWKYGPESGDWRFLALDIPAVIPGTWLVLRSRWADEMAAAGGTPVPAADVDSLLYSPRADRWTDPDHPDNRLDSVADPARFGPAGLGPPLRSAADYDGDGRWRFRSATGGYEDWLAARPQAGLHMVAAHNTLISGQRSDVPFQLAVDQLRLLPERIAGTAAGCTTAAISATWQLNELRATSFGLVAVNTVSPLPVRPLNPGNPSSPVWRQIFTVRQAERITATLSGGGDSDLDLTLSVDADGDGDPERLVAESAGAGASESIDWASPPNGQYALEVTRAARGSQALPARLDWVALQGDGIRISGLPNVPLPAGETAHFEICYDSPAGEPATWVGALLLGPAAVPGLVRMPIEVSVR